MMTQNIQPDQPQANRRGLAGLVTGSLGFVVGVALIEASSVASGIVAKNARANAKPTD